MKIEHLKNETYRVRKMVEGVKYTVYFDHRPTSREVMEKISDELRKNDSGLNSDTFGTFCARYIDSKRNVLSPSTIAGYQKLLRTLSPEFKEKKLKDIGQVDIQIEINTYAADHSPKSVRNLHGFISAVIGMFRPSMQVMTSLPQKKKYKHHLPTEDEVKRILEAAEGTEYHIPFQLAVLGLRRSEICAATPEDIRGNVLTVCKAKIYDENNRIVTRDNTKTEESTREVFLPDGLVAEIERQGKIFDRTPGALLGALHRFQDELGIERFRLHDFRGYYASYAHSIGIPDEYIMRSGGWKTDHIMKSVYRDILKDRNESMQKKIADSIIGG